MKKMLLAASAALLLSTFVAPAVSTAFAQGVSVTVSPEDRTRIKKYVVDHKTRSVTLKERRVGAKIPADVELTTVPGDWGPSYSKYRYIYSDDHVVLVDPGTREVVHVID